MNAQKMEWYDRYSVKIPLFDSQHKKLLEMINELNESMQSMKGDEVISSVIDKMGGYTQHHFTSEEKYMKKYKFPKMKAHIEAHHGFIEELGNFKKKMRGSRLLVSIEALLFLKDWLIKHIMGMDKEYSGFFLKKGLDKIK